MISLSEGSVVFGDQMLGLDGSIAAAGQAQTVNASAATNLQTRTVVVLGKTVNGAYDATLPVACGQITAK